jgi:hypothetical protein
MDNGNDYDNGDYGNEESPAPRANQLARRDFSGMALATENMATQALIAKARADIEARWIMAMRRPRNLDDVRQTILKECRRPGFAKAATYSVPRGGKPIIGLSIRFAEVAARCMGNLPVETQTIYDSDNERIVRVTVTDLETNVTWSRDLTIKKTVERKQLARGQRPLGDRVNSYGDRVYIVPGTDDDVAVKEAAAISKAVRTLILRLIPGHIQDEAEALCLQIARDQAAKDPDGERMRMLDAFARYSILPSDLADYLGHTTERLSPAEITELRAIYQAIGDGETTWQEVLENKPKAQPSPARATSSPVAQQATNAPAAAQQPTPAPAAPAAKPASPRGGKGTAALKNKLDTATDQARERDAARANKPDDPEAEPSWMAGKGEPAPDEPKCTKCGVPVAEPGQCYACSQS